MSRVVITATPQRTELTLEQKVRLAVDACRSKTQNEHDLKKIQVEKNALLSKLQQRNISPEEKAVTQASLAVICAHLGAYLPCTSDEKFQNWLDAGKLYVELANLCEATWYEAGIAYKATAECRFDHRSKANQLKFYLQAALCFQRSIPLDQKNSYFYDKADSTRNAFEQVFKIMSYASTMNHTDMDDATFKQFQKSFHMMQYYYGHVKEKKTPRFQNFVSRYQKMYAAISEGQKNKTRGGSTPSQKNAAKEMLDTVTGINSVTLDKEIEAMFLLHQELFGAAVSSNEPSTPPPPYAQSVAARAHPPTPPAALLPDPVTFSSMFTLPPYQLPAPIKKTQHNPYGHTAFVEPEESNTNTTLSPR